MTDESSRSSMIPKPSAQAKLALRELLSAVFTPHELRRWLAGRDPTHELIQELPDVSVAWSVTLDEAIALLARHRVVNEEFYADLVAARPNWRADIERVAAIWKPAARRPVRSADSSAPRTQQGDVQFAGPVTFNVGRDVIQGDKHEVHHHYQGGGAGPGLASTAALEPALRRRLLTALCSLMPSQFGTVLVLCGLHTSPDISPAPAKLATRAADLLAILEQRPALLPEILSALSEVGLPLR